MRRLHRVGHRHGRRRSSVRCPPSRAITSSSRPPPRTGGCRPRPAAARSRDRGDRPHRAACCYLSRYGQFLENALHCERDLQWPRRPAGLGRDRCRGLRQAPHLARHRRHPDDLRAAPVRRRRLGRLPVPVHLQRPRLPEPITGRVHQPPPVHQVFEGHNFVVCNFVPRKVDYHPPSIPVPLLPLQRRPDEIMSTAAELRGAQGSGIGQGSAWSTPAGWRTASAARRLRT